MRPSVRLARPRISSATWVAAPPRSVSRGAAIGWGKRCTKSRVLAIGLDGYEESLERQLLESGELPALRKLRKESARSTERPKRSGLALEHVKHRLGGRTVGPMGRRPFRPRDVRGVAGRDPPPTVSGPACRADGRLRCTLFRPGAGPGGKGRAQLGRPRSRCTAGLASVGSSRRVPRRGLDLRARVGITDAHPGDG